ncbi:hypothetical protein EVAR_48680_1 [Eumeta japonica]|uniref:Uncharacterized protein n=1 Tax=Eumeta variegata TaxID=151549 RepID=A0A4C1X7G0_EUMVA|nr:hypothetical protein EVAR_48680_1 [Eumeta japonica]
MPESPIQKNRWFWCRHFAGRTATFGQRGPVVRTLTARARQKAAPIKKDLRSASRGGTGINMDLSGEAHLLGAAPT